MKLDKNAALEIDELLSGGLHGPYESEGLCPLVTRPIIIKYCFDFIISGDFRL